MCFIMSLTQIKSLAKLFFDNFFFFKSNGISSFVGNIMSNLSLKKNSSDTM